MAKSFGCFMNPTQLILILRAFRKNYLDTSPYNIATSIDHRTQISECVKLYVYVFNRIRKLNLVFGERTIEVFLI